MPITIPKGATAAYEPALEAVQSEYHSDLAPQAISYASHNDKYSVEPFTIQHDERSHQYQGREGQEVHINMANTGSTKKRKLWIALGIGAVLVIAGATVGGVIGSRGNSQDGNPKGSNDAPPISPEIMTGSASPTSVAAGLAPTAVSWGGRHLEVFALTKNHTSPLYWKWRRENATSNDDFEPENLELAVAGDAIDIDTSKTPSIALHARLQTKDGNRVDVLLTSSGGRLTQTWHSPSQRLRPSKPETPWFPMSTMKDALLLSAPVMVSYPMEHNMMKAVFLGQSGTNTSVWYIDYVSSTDDWTPPVPIKGPDLHTWATPAAVAWSGDSSRLDIFAVSKDNNHLLHYFSDNTFSYWSEYEDLGGFITTPPTVVSGTDGCLDVFARGGDGGLWHLSFESSHQTWSRWRRISGTTRIQGQPHAVSSSYKSIDVFAWGEHEGAMLYKTYDALTGKWTPGDEEFTTLIPSGLAGPPKGIVVDNDVHVFAYDDQNQILRQTIGLNKIAVGDAQIWAKVPSSVF